MQQSHVLPGALASSERNHLRLKFALSRVGPDRRVILIERTADELRIELCLPRPVMGALVLGLVASHPVVAQFVGPLVKLALAALGAHQ